MRKTIHSLYCCAQSEYHILCNMCYEGPFVRLYGVLGLEVARTPAHAHTPAHSRTPAHSPTHSCTLPLTRKHSCQCYIRTYAMYSCQRENDKNRIKHSNIEVYVKFESGCDQKL